MAFVRRHKFSGLHRIRQRSSLNSRFQACGTDALVNLLLSAN